MKSLIQVFLVLLIFGQLPAFAGGDKKVARVSFHIETEGTDNPKMIFPQVVSGERRFFRRVPEITSSDFVGFSPFPSDVEGTYGVVFELKRNASTRLAAVSSANQKRWMVCQAFGRVIDEVIIDRPVEDGMIVIWKGLTLEEVAQLDKSFPRIGEKEKRD